MTAVSPRPSIADTAPPAPAASLRDAYFDALFEIAAEDDRVCVVTADMGAPSLDRFWRELPKQFYQIGIAEAQAVSFAAGLAREGRRPYVYGIAPFVTGRAFEQVKLDVCEPGLPVTILGAGAGLSYNDAGPSHHAIDDVGLMRLLPGMTVWSPSDASTSAAIARFEYDSWRIGMQQPAYVRFDREALPSLGDDAEATVARGYRVRREDIDPGAIIAATGSIVIEAMRAAAVLPRRYRPVVVEVVQVRPLNLGPIGEAAVVAVEEHFESSGLGAAIAYAHPGARVLRIGLPDTFTADFVRECGSREYLRRQCGLDAETIARRIEAWLR